MMDDAVEITLWPLVYSGNGGVCNAGVQLGSIFWLMKVSGRHRLLRYFSSQQLINPSKRPIDTNAYASAVFIMSALALRVTRPTMPIQWPPGVIFFDAYIRCPCWC